MKRLLFATVLATPIAGCDTLEELVPRPTCEHRIEVLDETTGEVDLVLDESDCEPDENFPDSVEYYSALDDSFEPITAATLGNCNVASTEVLRVEGLADDELQYDLVTAEHGTVVADWPENLVEDGWMLVNYSDTSLDSDASSMSRQAWRAYFRLGHPGTTIYEEDCVWE